ncbi:MAG: hypothetical protein ACRCV9_20565 [Burkholderiaceae bacterium]
MFERFKPAWDGQCLITNYGWFFRGRITRQMSMQVPMLQWVQPELEHYSATQLVSLADLERATIIVHPDEPSVTPKLGFVGHVLLIDPTTALARFLRHLPSHKPMPWLNQERLAAVAQQAMYQKNLQIYIQAVCEEMQLDLAPLPAVLRHSEHHGRLGYLFDHLNQALNCPAASEAAQMCGLSASRFSVAFREEAGLPYAKYSMGLKVRNYLFQSTRLARTVSSNVHKAGFYDLSHATRQIGRFITATLTDTHGLRAVADQSLVDSAHGPESLPKPTSPQAVQESEQLTA